MSSNLDPGASFGSVYCDVAAEAAAEAAIVLPKKKGANFKGPEDLIMSKVFVSASEDKIVGTNQKTTAFKAKFFQIY